MNLILFDDSARPHLLPLAFTRPISEFRVGILTIREKWEMLLGLKASWLTETWLAEKYPMISASAENLIVNAGILPTRVLCEEILGLKNGEFLMSGSVPVAANLDATALQEFQQGNLPSYIMVKDTAYDFLKINRLWDIFTLNDQALRGDFDMLTRGRESQPISLTNRVISSENIFLEPGAVVECSTLNAATGPIYIGADAEVMEGCLIRGSFALCEHAGLKMGAKIYGATTLGPYCKAGGEVSNSVMFGYSNKGHEGFLGNSVLGEWCNLGADTNNSNLKNNYAPVKLYNYHLKEMENSNLQFCGLMMGDHSKCGINTMFNTGTVVGVSCNIYGAGFPPNFIPDFSWGGAEGLEEYQIGKAFETAERVMQRRGLNLTDTDKRILTHIYHNKSTQ